MKRYINTMISSVFLAGLFALILSPEAGAVPVIDTSSTIQETKSFCTKVKENATVVTIMTHVKKGAAAIGTAKKSVSEYVVKKKQKIEKVAAKVKKYKDKVEQYKKEYEEYKAELDENIAKAREFKKEMEDGIQEAKDGVQAAKDTVSTAKDVASAVKDKANSTISDVKGKVDDAASKVGLKGNSTPDVAASEPAAEPAVSKDEAAKTEDIAVVEPEPAAPVSGRKPFEAASDVAIPATSTETPAAGTDTSAGAADTVSDSVAALPADITNAAPVVVSGSANAAETIKPEPEQTPAKQEGGEIKTLQTETPSADAPKWKFRRKAFTTSALRTTETLAFAKLSLPDGGTDVNGNVLIPRALAMYCGLSSADAAKEGVVDECLLKINKERRSAQVYSGSDAPKVYNLAVAQSVAATIAEAFKARQDADSFIEKFVEPIEYAPENTARDTYANIVQLNQAIDMQMNNLLKIQSSKLATRALINYGEGLYAPEEDENE